MYSAIGSNKRKTILLMAVFVGFIATMGYVFGAASGSPSIFYYVGIGALIYTLVMYFASAKIALKMSGAREVFKKDAPELYRLVENLSIAAGLPTPKVYIVDDPSPNAFATGRNPKNAVVAVTSGLLQALEKEELEGVLAHELAHIGNYDIRLATVVTGLVSVVAFVSDIFQWSLWGGGDDDSPSPIFLVLAIVSAILAPLIATVIQLAISRRREYLADATAALITRYPEGLARALEKISSAQPMNQAHSATAHLYIASPLGGKRAGSFIASLFSTHPPAKDRIKRLREMEDKV